MLKIKKVIFKIKEQIIKKINYLNPIIYMKYYNKHLKKQGVQINSGANYIDPSVYLDGTDYSKIYIGDYSVISKDVIILTHDLSLQRAFFYLNLETDSLSGFLNDVSIGENSFIGAGSIILPGTKIGCNCIIGAGSVVKGNIEDYSIVVSGQLRVIGDVREWGKVKYAEQSYKKF